MGPFSRALARYLNRPNRYQPTGVVQSEAVLRATLQPADVLLVEGNSRVSTAIKYLTQSVWSHAALYAGPDVGSTALGGDSPELIEADLQEGVIAVPLAKYAGMPTRAICSTLIAQAFQSVHYPILPDISHVATDECDTCVREILHIRHHSLFAPRDFDLSPYFEVVKPAIRDGFDPSTLNWADTAAARPGAEAAITR